MNPGILLLLLLAMRKHSASSTTTPAINTTAAPAGPANFPASQPANVTPVSYPLQTAQWVAMKPVTPFVVARANAILRDPSKPTPSETIEKDDTGRDVRYVKLNAPPGKKSVIATVRRQQQASQSTAI